MSRAALALAALVCLSASASAFKVETLPRVGVQSVRKPIEVVAEQVLVKFSSGTSAAQRGQVAALVGGSVGPEVAGTGWNVVYLSSGMSVATGLSLLKGAAGVDNYQPNHVYRINALASDPLVPQQWSLQKVDAPAAWDFETGTSNKVTIAFLDAGIDGTHPDLAPKLANTVSQDCSSGACVNENPPHPACDHGTRTSGIAAAAANNGTGIAGLSWGAQLISLKVFPDGGCPSPDCSDTSCGATDSAMAAAITQAQSLNNTAAIGRIIVNMSLGASGLSCAGTCPGVDCYQNTATAIANAAAAGIPFAISAGNDSGPVNSPADCASTIPGVIPVGATDSNDNIAFFSSNGSVLASYGVSAPGYNVETTDINGAYTGSATGTSFSAPHVSGVLALLLSAQPTATPTQLQAWIRGGADNIGASPNSQGAGRLDAFRSLRLAVRGTLSDFAGDEKAIAFPNPFRVSQNGAVTITVPTSLQSSNATTKIFTPGGQLVRTTPGLTWDGKNDAGQFVASGTYIFEVKTDAGHTTGRLAVIR